MRYTKTLLGKEARDALKRGADQVYNPVSVTIGAKGRDAVFPSFPFPTVTNDGVSIARQINPRDEFERFGAQLIRQTSERTNEEAGDGTTTACVLAHKLISHGLERLEGGESPIVIQKELKDAKDLIVKKIQEVSRETTKKEDILNVAKISVGDDELAEIVADAIEHAGQNGIVIVEEGNGYEVEKEEISGYFWSGGYISPYMITNPDKNQAVIEDVPVVVTDRYMNLNKDLMPLLNEIAQSGTNKAFIIADNVDGELLQSIIANKMQGSFTAIVVKRPPTTEELEDIAVLTGATAVTKEKDIKRIMYAHCGKASRIIASKDQTIVVGDGSEMLQSHVENLQKDIEEDKDNILKKDRLAKLTDGIVVLRAGAKTEAERKYRKDKLDDAVGACRAAQAEGIVEGAGITLAKIADEMKSETVADALRAPHNKILENAGIESDGKAYNVLTGKEVKDLFKEGIIDPAKVERCAVENAISLASRFLVIESVTAQFEEGEEKQLLV